MSIQAEVPYERLGPDQVLDAIEGLGIMADGRLLALNSYENRVYRIGVEGGPPLVAKFYRPGRWTEAGILEEHAFTAELVEADLPVVAPLLIGGASLHAHEGFRFALFPTIGGRSPEPGDRDGLRRIGRTLARLHSIGRRTAFEHRPRLDVVNHGVAPVEALLEGRWLPAHLVAPFRAISAQVLATIADIWAGAGQFATLRLHGDCHYGNLLERNDEILLVDFDDCLSGPAIQDLWMLVSGEGDDLRRQWGWLLEGYSLFADPDPREFALVEALRTLRILHYHGWIARRWGDPAFPLAFPWFEEQRHWETLVGQLQEQLAAMQEPVVIS
ncbi:serine/threonine protein kinase [Pseudofulvimonas gallinarii]|uniref:Stress response kinase A n=1 Tax=Pseudofulvimonas gallinarii TaxID=634155 RepID=A0A4R3LRM1_9GAMM|nr:Ser/Thr protein kinase RdoA (MazF antagonist) [Pseudofulvimonas gallinarii]